MYLTACVFSLQHSYVGRTADVALGVAVPLHSHVAINSVLSDYVPKSVRGQHTQNSMLSSGALHSLLLSACSLKSITLRMHRCCTLWGTGFHHSHVPGFDEAQPHGAWDYGNGQAAVEEVMEELMYVVNAVKCSFKSRG